MSRSVLSLLLLFLLPAQLLLAQESRVGQQVMPRIGCEVALPGHKVDLDTLTVPYTVELVKEDWFWVSQGDKRKGWVHPNSVVPLDEAVDYYSEQIEKEETAWALNMRSAAHRALGALDEALADAEASLEKEPDNALALRLRGLALAEQKKFDEALADLDQAVEKQPNSPLPLLARGVVHERAGDFEKAEADYTAAIELDAKYARPWLHRGNVRWQRGDLVPARVDYTEAIRRDRQCAPAYINRGRTWLDGNELDKAIRDFDRAIELGGSIFSEAHYNRGLAHLRRASYDQATRDFSRAIAMNGEQPEAYNNRGIAYRRRGEYDRAVSDFKAAIKKNPKYLEAHRNLGQTQLTQGEYEAALDDLEAALKIEPDDLLSLIDAAWILAAAPEDDLRDGKKARKYAERAVKTSDKKNPRALSALAAAHAELGDFDAAQKTQEQANEVGFIGEVAREQAQMLLERYKSEKPIRLGNNNAE